MLGARTLVAVLVLFHVGLLTVAAVQSADFAWVPSYFDDDDGDFLPLLLSEQMSALVEPARGWMPALIVLASTASAHRCRVKSSVSCTPGENFAKCSSMPSLK